jgi:hypothetical protein
LIFAARFSYFRQLAELDDQWDEFDDFDYQSLYTDSSFFEHADDEQSNYSQWLTEKQHERAHGEREQEVREERMADEILKKLHRDGIEKLSDEEKGILNRVSARIRRRRQMSGQ